MARLKAVAAGIADSGRPASQEKALGSRCGYLLLSSKSEWNGSCIKRFTLRAAVSGIIQISPHGKAATATATATVPAPASHLNSLGYGSLSISYGAGS